jgi:hypothetical protein
LTNNETNNDSTSEVDNTYETAPSKVTDPYDSTKGDENAEIVEIKVKEKKVKMSVTTALISTLDSALKLYNDERNKLTQENIALKQRRQFKLENWDTFDDSDEDDEGNDTGWILQNEYDFIKLAPNSSLKQRVNAHVLMFCGMARANEPRTLTVGPH